MALALPLLRDEQPSVRGACCTCLGAIRNEATIPLLLAVLRSDPEPCVQTGSLLGIENYHSVEIGEVLLSVLEAGCLTGSALAILCRQLWKYPSHRTGAMLQRVLQSSTELPQRSVVESSDVLAIADQKGRLLFGSAGPRVWGAQITTVPVIAVAYTAPTDTYIGVIEGDDPLVVSSGLLGGTPRKGLYVLFTRAKRIGPQPRAMFVQAIEAARLLDEVSLGEAARLSLLAPDGNAEGTVPHEILHRAASDGIAVLAIDRREWLAERTPLRAGEQREAFAQIVLARESDVGLAGLFPDARRMFAMLAFLLAGLAVGARVIAWRSDLTRSVGRPITKPSPS